MEQNKNTLYGSDLIKLLFKKFKLIVIVGLIAAIVGGCIGALLTSFRAEYTAEINISVTPVDDSDKLLFDLRSGRFAETLLLDENGLPKNGSGEDYNNALKAIKAYEEAREKRWEKYLEKTNYHISDIESAYKRLEAEYTEAFNLLKMYKDADGEAFVNNEDHLKMIALCEAKLLEVQAKKQAYYEEYYLPATEKLVKLQSEYAVLCDEVNTTRRAAEAATEKVLEVFRTTPGVADKVKKIMESSKYEYFESNSSSVDSTGAEIVGMEKGYIKVTFTVPAEDAEFAKSVVNAYKTRICDYAKKHIEKTSDQANVECVLVNPIVTLEETADTEAYITSAIKYALVVGVLAAILFYVILVLKMMIGAEKKHPAE